ncbi:zinc-ribbon domain-containing protein [Streptomyces sp. NPDC055078]
MIIFGTKGYLHQLAILTLVCGFCGNPSAHTLRKRVTKFTLFFIPLFPVSTKHATQCTFCGAESQVTKEQADQLVAQSAGGPGGLGGPGGQGGQGGPGGGQGFAQPYGQPQGQQGQNPYQS